MLSFVSLIFLPCKLLADDTITKTIQSLTLEQKVGQLMMVGFQGKDLNKKEIAFLRKIQPGGIVFYARNLKSVSDLPPVISKIKALINDKNFPPFFAVDQEGGIVHRIEGENYRPPSAPAIGATNSEVLANKAGISVGSVLKNLGMSVNLAPVLDIPADISSSPMTGRSFSTNPQAVAGLGVAYIQGLKYSGLLATAKHFPGIGRANEDSHSRLPRVTWATQDEKENDMMPFKSAVRAGVDILMVGHFIAAPGDEKNPVSLSPYWMKDVLRKDMNFDGLIIVDNIEMKPIHDMMPVSEAAVQSFKAGADIIIVSHERENQEAVFSALVNAVKKGTVSQERLNESLRRIFVAKNRIVSGDPVKVSVRELNDISRLVAENSVTVLKLNDSPLYTIQKNEKVLFVGNDTHLFNVFKDFWEQTDIMNSSLANFSIMKPEITITDFLKKFDSLILDADYGDAPEMVSICNTLNLKYIVVLSRPSNIQNIFMRYYPKLVVVIYESSKIQLTTAIEIMSGIRRAKGRFPFSIELPDSYIQVN